MNRIRVLLADDHIIVAQGLQRILEIEFEVVGIAEDGLALLKAAKELKPDVIVADISMPNLNGIDALEELKKFNPDARVVIFTMHREVDYARKALSAGAMGYVLKQSAPEELTLAVRAAAAGRTFVTSELTEELLRDMEQGEREDKDPIDTLTLRQREILRFLIDGKSAKAIARSLDISPRTVESHKYSMMETLGISTTAELIRFAISNGFADM